MLTSAPPNHRDALLARFRRVRKASVAMCQPLSAEEFRMQTMPDVSPPWWNLGHTTWFFARNVLGKFGGPRIPADDELEYVLNSYYVSFGDRLPRDRRGSLSRPTTDEVMRYRASVDDRVERLIESADDNVLNEMLDVLRIGIEHEQQHQELFYTEIKHIRFQNPPALREAYAHPLPLEVGQGEPRDVADFIDFSGGLFEFGNSEGDWCWDNELPVHKQYLEPFALADRLVTNAEYLEFIDDGGYRQPLLWLDNGWRQVQAEGWTAPLYWERAGGDWSIWTLRGNEPLNSNEPVCHVSFYEADAFARWRGVRLPTEREWEHAARSDTSALDETSEPNAFVDAGNLHPHAATALHAQSLRQMHGCVWQWTNSYYEPYPGYRPFAGALAEYNGKFMDNQRVLRGGSFATPRDHYRISYRNFWPAATRFQFTGIRLAKGLDV
jgi:ergothioneine biosynthesis protein EgtB